MLLFVIGINGAITMGGPEVTDQYHDQACVLVASELRKDPKVSDAFCIVTDPDDNNQLKIGRRTTDLQGKNDGKSSN